MIKEKSEFMKRRLPIILFAFFLLFIFSCRLFSSQNLVQQTESSKESSPTSEIDLVVERLPAGDDLLFFSLLQDKRGVIGIASDIHSINTNGGTPSCVTCKLNVDEYDFEANSNLFWLPPSLSPVRKTLAIGGSLLNTEKSVITYDGLWMIDLSSGRVRILLNNDDFKYPDWSEDGKQIAFVNEGINILNAKSGEFDFQQDGTEFTPENPKDGFIPDADWVGNFSWSPNGIYILYDDGFEKIVRVNINELTAIVLRPPEPIDAYDKPTFTFPVWSPDGTKITYISDVAGRETNVTWEQLMSGIEFRSGGGNFLIATDLYVMNEDGSDQICITCDKANAPDRSFTPSWSPDGKQIAFFGHDFSQLPDRYEHLLVVNLETGELKSLAHFPQNGIYGYNTLKESGPPQWSRDGQRLAFSAINENYNAVFVINRDGSNLKLVAYDSGRDFVFPLWIDTP